MKKIQKKSLQFLGIMVAITLIIWACSKGNEFPVSQKASATSAKDNAEIVMATQEAMDIADGSMADQGISDGSASSGGRIETAAHGDWDNCGAIISGTFSIDRTHPDSTIFSGTITIDYKDGAACKDTTNVKKGKMVDNFVFIFSWRGLLSSTQNISFSGFTSGSKTVDGVFISKYVRKGISSIEFQGAKITYKDGTSVSWDGSFMSEYNNGGTASIRSDDTRKITGSIHGTARDGNAFSAEITKEILFKYSCSIRRIPVSGTIVITSGSVTSSIDFGDGTCDRVYTTTSAGVTEEHNL